MVISGHASEVARFRQRAPVHLWVFWESAVEKCSRVMLNGRVKPAEAKKYWQGVLDMIPNADKAWDFCALDWDALWKDAHRVHTSNGKYAGSCINLLTANTQARLSLPKIDLSLFG